jgi:iron complex transport system ATP-binding protein
MISCKNIDYTINSTLLLSSIDLAITPEKITAVLGANGAGKSTLLKVMLGINKADSDEVFFNGKPLWQWSIEDLATRLAYMTQSSAVKLSIPVYEYLLLARVHITESKQATNQAVEAVIELLNLHSLATRSLSSLSGGEFQRIELARAWCQLLHNGCFTNSLLVLDEASSALDIYQSQRLYQHLQTFTERGGTVVIVEHDINLAARFCDKLLLIKQGKVVAHDTVETVFKSNIISDCFGVEGRVITDERHQIHSFALNG